MKVRRYTLAAFVSGLFLSLLVLSSTALAAPAQQVGPPAKGQTTAAANLRSGPGTTYAKVGSLPEGKTVVIASCSKACDWYQLEDGAWIAAFLVEPLEQGAAEQPSTSAEPPAAIPTATTVPAAIGAQATQGATASSDGNLRGGPGTGYARVGGVTVGQSLDITGRTAASDWYQLADGNWIAAILVGNPPVDAAVVEAPSAPVAPSAPAGGGSTATSEEVMQEAMKLWQERIDLNTTKTCGHFEYKLTDVRRKKSLWLFSREYVAQGEWLMVFVEVKNISPGTSYWATSVRAW